MLLSGSLWWWAPFLALAWIVTLPAQIFSAPARAWLMAAARFMPGVCAVFGSSEVAGITLTPFSRQSVASGGRWCSWSLIGTSYGCGGAHQLFRAVGPRAPDRPYRLMGANV